MLMYLSPLFGVNIVALNSVISVLLFGPGASQFPMGSANHIDKFFGRSSGSGKRANEGSFTEGHVFYHTVQGHLEAQISASRLVFLKTFGRHQRQSHMFQNVKDEPENIDE